MFYTFVPFLEINWCTARIMSRQSHVDISIPGVEGSCKEQNNQPIQNSSKIFTLATA